MIRGTIFTLLICIGAIDMARANVVSAEYVKATVETKVDTKSDADQELAGRYVITGTLEVPDAPLPTAMQ